MLRIQWIPHPHWSNEKLVSKLETIYFSLSVAIVSMLLLLTVCCLSFNSKLFLTVCCLYVATSHCMLPVIQQCSYTPHCMLPIHFMLLLPSLICCYLYYSYLSIFHCYFSLYLHSMLLFFTFITLTFIDLISSSYHYHLYIPLMLISWSFNFQIKYLI